MNAATASVAPARIDALDGLRALAMTAVVAQHCHLLPFGWTGVSEEGLLGCIAALVDSAELRARLGDAAREEALSRFSRAGRSEALIESYRTAAAQRVVEATDAPSQPLPRLGRAITATDQRCPSTPAGDPG